MPGPNKTGDQCDHRPCLHRDGPIITCLADVAPHVRINCHVFKNFEACRSAVRDNVGPKHTQKKTMDVCVHGNDESWTDDHEGDLNRLLKVRARRTAKAPLSARKSEGR